VGRGMAAMTVGEGLSGRLSAPAPFPRGPSARLWGWTDTTHRPGCAMQLKGIHHLTAVSARIRDNYRFYTEVMGLRLVKRTVNQDDVSAYHLFYADQVGTPGTDLTFFHWASPGERRGTGSVVRSFLRVRDRDSLEWWSDRFLEVDLSHTGLLETDGRKRIEFQDPEGQRLGLVEDGGAGDDPVPWPESPVPQEHQIRGLGPVVLSVPALEGTDAVLTRVMGMERLRHYTHRHEDESAGEIADPEGARSEGSEIRVYGMGGDGPHAELHVAVQPHLGPARLGAGGVHHVAFRTPDEEYDAWARRLNELRVPNSGPVDRYYFRSLYFREPAGILFEIATDGPGFVVDEKVAELGESLVLPPFLEDRREEIEAGLEPID